MSQASFNSTFCSSAESWRWSSEVRLYHQLWTLHACALRHSTWLDGSKFSWGASLALHAEFSGVQSTSWLQEQVQTDASLQWTEDETHNLRKTENNSCQRAEHCCTRIPQGKAGYFNYLADNCSKFSDIVRWSDSCVQFVHRSEDERQLTYASSNWEPWTARSKTATWKLIHDRRQANRGCRGAGCNNR